MDHQQYHRLPHGGGVGQEHDAPADRNTHEQQHAELDEAAYVEAIGQPAGVTAEKKKGTQCETTAKAPKAGE